MENITITIDGRAVSCRAGTSLLDAADRLEIPIPRLCHHPDLKPFGACRLCLMEDEKTTRLFAACVTPVAPGMAVKTDTPRIVTHRRNIIRLMMSEHPESCIVCNKGNRCRLRHIAAQLGVGETDLYPLSNERPLEQANPFIVRDLTKCILCGKCIRADHELVVVGAIDYNHRGFRSRPATVHEKDLGDSNCTFCGTCVSICPTGALSTKHHAFAGTPARETDSVCGFCGVGCHLAIGVVNNKIVEVNPAHHPQSVNGATLCVRGHFAHDFLNNPKRIFGPRVRKKIGENDLPALVPGSWTEAIDLVANRLGEISAESGPQSIGFIGSSKCTNEENYLFQKMARVVVKSNNIDNGGYIYGQRQVMQVDKKTGGRYRKNPLSRLENSECILVLGANPNHSVPVVSYYIKRAVQKGIPLIVVDPRRTEMAACSSVWLAAAPQSDHMLLNGLSAMLIARNEYDAAFIDQWSAGFNLYRYSLSSLNLDNVSNYTGLETHLVEKTIELMRGKKISVVVGNGVLQQRHARHTMDALMNLRLITGSLGGENAGFYLLAKENNQVGAADMGAMPDRLPGRGVLTETETRKYWEKAWNTPLSPDPGLNLVGMITAMEKGHLKALYIMGENPLRALPDPARVKKAFSKLEFLVVQDILHTETTAIADVVLPGAAFSEKGGTFTNLEGRIQSFEPVISPPGHAKPDWKILDLLIGKMGHAADYGSVPAISKEIRRLVPMYARMNGSRHGWVQDVSVGGQPQIAFAPVVSTGNKVFSETHSFTAIVGSHRYHLGAGTRTGCSQRIQEIAADGHIEISPEDASKLGLKTGDRVRVGSVNGELDGLVMVKKESRPRQVFVPTAVTLNSAMALIGLSDLGTAETPGWKTCPVTLEKINEAT